METHISSRISSTKIFRAFLELIREDLIKKHSHLKIEMKKKGFGSRSILKFVLEMRENGASLQLKDAQDLEGFEILGFGRKNNYGEEKKDRGLEKADLVQALKICEEAIDFDDEKLWAFACGYTLGRMAAERDETSLLKEHSKVKASIAGQKPRKPRKPKAVREYIVAFISKARPCPRNGEQLAAYLARYSPLEGDFSHFEVNERGVSYLQRGEKKSLSFETLRRYLKNANKSNK